MFKTQIIAILIFHPGHTKKSIFYLMHNIETLIRAFHKFQELSQKVSRNWSKKLLKRCSKKSKVAFCNESCSKKTFDKFCPQFKPKKCSLRSAEIAAFVQVLSCSRFCGYPIRIWIPFFTWDTLISRVWVTDLAAWLPRGRNWLHFHRKLINCLLIHCEIWKQRQFKHYKLLRYLRIDRKLEIARICKKLPCNFWKALTLIMANFLDFTLCKM